MSDATLLQLIGHRLTQLRLAKNLTQEELAKETGLGLRTVQRLESGAAATQLSGFVRIIRALGLLERLDALIPEQTPSPIAQLKLHGKKRQRASGEKAPPSKSKKWKWGEPS